MKPYCLRCFAPLPGESRNCPDCGFVSIRTLRMRYWNQHPGIISLENTLKGGIVFLIGKNCSQWKRKKIARRGAA